MLVLLVFKLTRESNVRCRQKEWYGVGEGAGESCIRPHDGHGKDQQGGDQVDKVEEGQ